jgi:large subunit ribosomal protein L10
VSQAYTFESLKTRWLAELSQARLSRHCPTNGISADPVNAAKVLSAFAKDNDKLVIKAGALPNSLLDVNGVKALATMPSREELLSKLLGTMQAPIAQFVRTLNEVPTKFVRGLAAVRDQKEAA